MFCSAPWVRMGLSKDLQYSCCFTQQPSYCQPCKLSSEIVNEDFNNEGLLMKVWNSHNFQIQRKIMSNNGINEACNREKCDAIINIDNLKYKIHTDIQQQNYNKLVDNINSKNTYVDHYPLLLEIILDGICNMECFHCCQAGAKMYPLPINNFKEEMINFLKYAVSCYLLGGEPTICNDYDNFISFVKEANGALLNIMTNGHFIIEKVLPNMDYISDLTVSVDAATPETYAKIRTSKNNNYNFDRLLFNLRRLNDHTKRKRVNVVYSNVIDGLNYHEMNDMVLLAVEHKANAIFIGEVVDITYSIDKQDIIKWGLNNEIVAEYLYKSIETAKKQGIHLCYNFPSLNKVGGF
jgi:uncharacterized radical SAM superfamily Fe-S cluster-containing enzyme